MNNDIDFVFFIHTMADCQHPAWTLGRKHPELQEQCRFIISLCTLVRPYNEQHTLCDKCGRFLETLLYISLHRASRCKHKEKNVGVT